MAKKRSPGQGSGITYKPAGPTRDIEIRPDNPAGLWAANRFGVNYAPDYTAIARQNYEADPSAQAYDSFGIYRTGWAWGQPKGLIERYGLSVADRAAGPYDVTIGMASALGQQGASTDGRSVLSPFEVEYYSSGGENAWDVSVDEYGLPPNLAATARDMLIQSIESRRDTSTKVVWLAMHAPAAIAALSERNMDPVDVATAHNVYVAQQAVDRAIAFVDEGLPLGAAQLINILPIRQRIIAAALLDGEISRRQEEATAQQVQIQQQQTERNTLATPQLTPGPFQNTRDVRTTSVTTDDNVIEAPIFGPQGPVGSDQSGTDVLGWLLDATLWGVNQVTHAARVLSLLRDEVGNPTNNYEAMITPASGEQQITDSLLANLGALWQATSEGFISQAGYTELLEKYGDKAQVDTAIGLYYAQLSDDPSAVENFKASIASDPVQVAWVQSMLRGENVFGDRNNAAELMVDVAARDQGNFGNIVASGILGLDSGTLPFSVTRDAANVTSWFLFDPLLWAGGAGKAFRASKYGLDAINKYGSIGNVIRAKNLGPLADTPILGNVTGVNGVAYQYDRFGSAVKAFTETDDLATRAAILDRASREFFGQRNSMLSRADWDVAEKYSLFTAEDWANYFDDIDDAGKILAGKKIPVYAPQRIDGSKTGLDFLNQYAPDAFQAPRRAAISQAESRAYEGLDLAVQSARGQQVRRPVYMPHSTVARATVRGLIGSSVYAKIAPPAYLERAVDSLKRVIDDPAFTNGTADEQMQILRSVLSNDEAMARALGLELGDWKLIDGQMQRTLMGRFVDSMFDHSDEARRVGSVLGFYKRSATKDGVTYLKVKGWKRDRQLFNPASRARGATENWARLLTRLPNLPNGLNVRTAEHADEVYRMAVAAGLGRGGADVIRLAWVGGTAASRQNMMIGLTRSFTAAMGLDAVDPGLSTRIMREMTGLRAKEEYATTHIPREAGVRAEIRRDVEQANEARRDEILAQPQPMDARIAELDGLIAQGGDVAALQSERNQLVKARDRRVQQQLRAINDDRDYAAAIREAEKPSGRLDRTTGAVNPSVDARGKASALYVGQTSDYMAVPNFKAMDEYAARQSFLNTFLFQGTAGTNITEAWVLGSLYGPRFALRNAFEDIALYILTGGKMGRFFLGRRIDEAVDEAMARVDKKFLATRRRAQDAERELRRVQAMQRAGKADVNLVQAAQEEYNIARDLLTKAETEKNLYGLTKYGQHKKRGIVQTTVLNISERLSWTATGRERDGVVARVARLIAPTTSTYERRKALEEGPEAMIRLAEAAVLRQNVVWNRKGWQKIIPARAKSREDLTPIQLQYLRDEEDFLNSSFGLTYKDMAAESASHLMDGSVPTLLNSGRYAFDDRGKLMRVLSVDEGYSISKINSNVLSPQQARGMMARLGYMTDKYGINQAAMLRLRQYWLAVNRPGGIDTVAADKVIDDVLEAARASRDWAFVAERFRLADDLGAREHVRRMMDDMVDAFTIRATGREKSLDELWNETLYQRVQFTDKNGKTRFGLERPNGDPTVSEIDFLTGELPVPSSVLVHGSEGQVLVPAKDMWSSTMWEQMGRSMSRMSRNPIYYSNYLQTRESLRPLERQWAEVFGEEYARKRFADAAAERAYELTMSWVDNPTIRTNLSWQVRNVARYYRAQEDFIRRMIRLAKFEPLAIQKANLAWQAQQDFGFVHRDDYGNDYFMYPGSAAVLEALEAIPFINVKYPMAPMGFSGNVQWLSPSLDLGSARPTLSSPIMAVTLQPLLRSMPVAENWFKVVENVMFGDVSANMDYTDLNLGEGFEENVAAGFYQALPPLVKKVIALGESISGNYLPGSYGYKMTTKTIMAMAAADQVPSQRELSDPAVRREFVQQMGRRTVEVSFLSLLFGLAAPASPQYAEDTLSMAAREEGFTALSPALREGIMASVKGGESWEEAYIRWLRGNPKDAALIVSVNESIGGSYVEATWNNVNFIQDNRELFDENPIGVTFFVPDEQGAGGGAEGQGAWAAMKMFNLRRPRELMDITDEVLMAEGKLQKMIMEAELADMAASTTHYDASGNVTDEWRTHEAASEVAKARLNSDYPTADTGYGDSIDKDSDSWAVEARQIVNANRSLRGSSPFALATAGLVETYVDIDREYRDFLSGASGDSLSRDDKKEEFKAIWQAAVAAWWRDWEGKYPEDRAENMLYVFTKALNTGWRDITLRGEG